MDSMTEVQFLAGALALFIFTMFRMELILPISNEYTHPPMRKGNRM
jgi:hypothetical protein